MGKSGEYILASLPVDGEVTQPAKNHNEERGQWGHQMEFILACIGYAVGLGNVWRFPYLVYENGGASFLIPYWISLIISGLPVFYLELSIGQFSSLGANKLYEKLCPIFTGLGWAMVTVSFTVSIYYNVIIAWVLLYFGLSFQNPLPWDTCIGSWNTAHCFTDRNVDYCQDHCPKIMNDTICDSFNTTDIFFFNKTCYFGSDNVKSGKELSDDYFKYHKKRPPAEEYFNQFVYGLPVSDDNATGLNEQQGFDQLGSLQWRICVCLLVAWIIVFFCLIKGVASTGKVVYFTATFPYVIMIILVIRGCTLDGADIGLQFYFNPNITKLTDIDVWQSAATQIFYSLGPGFGSLLTMASYNTFNNNCWRDAVIIAFINCCTSVFAGIAIFSTLGFLAKSSGETIDQVVESGPGLAFIAYPEALVRMPFPPIWSILFFFMLFTLGLDSQFAMVETITTAFFDDFTFLRGHKWVVIGTACIVMGLFGLPMCLQGGMFVFTLFDSYSGTFGLMLIALLEILVVCYIYGLKRYLADLQLMMGMKKGCIYATVGPYGWYWICTWMLIAPALLILIFVISLTQPQHNQYNGYPFPSEWESIGMVLAFLPIFMLPIFGTAKIIKLCKGYYLDGWREMFRSHDHWCPADQREVKKQHAADISNNVVNGYVNKISLDKY